jgi:hypothetical protein
MTTRERVQLQDAVADSPDIHLYAAQGEYESFKIAIKGNQDDSVVTDVQIFAYSSRFSLLSYF